MSSKSKSETPPTVKTPIGKTPTTRTSPGVGKLGRGVTKSETDSASPLPSSRLSVDRSPRSVASKPAADRRSPKISTPPEKPATRGVTKGSELQAQLNALQDDLKKAKEKLVSVEKEKEKAIDELKEAQRLSEETNEKLREALVAQKRAEESSEIEKFRAVEMEQAGIESAQKKEEEWEKEIETVRNQHALDVAALLSATQELQRVKQELAMTCDAKNQALTHADDATKIAEIQADKVEAMSSEITHLKALLNSKFETEADESNKVVSELKLELEMLKSEADQSNNLMSKLKLEIETLKSEADENNKLVSELKSKIETLESEADHSNKLVVELKLEIEALKSEAESRESEIETLSQELAKAKVYEEKLLEREASLEELNVNLEAARMSESYAHSLMEEWKKRVEELDLQAEEAKRLERSASSSLESVAKELERSNGLLHDAESELASLREKVGLLEMSNLRQKGDLEESERNSRTLKEEASELAKKFQILTLELETVKEEKMQALNNEKLAASSVQILLEEKNRLISELEGSKDEEEKSKKALESLASALHEVSSEAREAKEKLLSSQSDHENYEAQIEDLKLALQATNKKYQSMLDDAKHEIDMLMHSIEKTKKTHQDTESEWKEKEIHLMDCIKKYEKENVALEKEVGRMTNFLKETEEESNATNEERDQLKDSLKEAESEVTYLKEVLGEAKAESMKLKESLMDKENELQYVIQENEDLRTREATSLKKVEELSKLLEEAKEQVRQNGDVTDSEKDCDMLPKVVEFSERNGNGRDVMPKMELLLPQSEQPTKEKLQDENDVLYKEMAVKDTAEVPVELNGENDENKKSGKENDDTEVEFKMWESCKIDDNDFSPEREAGHEESFDEELDSKTENGEGSDQINGIPTTEESQENGGSSPSKQQQQKKKKPLLRKFGSLLKKKSTSNNQK